MTLTWAVAHRMTMMVANQTHRDSGVARDDYVDVFAALQAVGVCCIAKPSRRLAGAYAAPEHGGPVVLLNSNLDEMTMRHTAAHELGHHVFCHGSRADERVDPDGSSLGGLWPDEEKLAEAFAPWFLMPLPAVRTAMRRAGVYTPLPGWRSFLARVAIALCVLGATLWFAAGPDDFWVGAGLWAKIWRLTLVIIAGGVTYFGALWLLGFRLADFNRREPP